MDCNINVQTCFAREGGRLGEYQTLWKVGMYHEKMAVDSYSRFRVGSFGMDDKQS